MTSKTKKRMGYFLISIGVLYGLICLILYVFQERIMFFPEQLSADYKFQFQENFEEIYIEDISQNAKLHALWFKNKKLSERVILYFHGNAGSLAKWGNIAQDFIPLGYDVCIIDYRGYGKSKGKMSEETLFADAQKAFNFLKKHYQEKKISVFGRSIGTGIATHLASNNKAERLILETPYYNFPSLAAYHIPFLPTAWLLRYSLRSDKYLPKVTCPAYIFHGTADTVIPYKFGAQLAEMIPQTHFITIPEGNHNNLSSFPIYQKHLKEILTVSQK